MGRVTGDLPHDGLSLVSRWETAGAGQEDRWANPAGCTSTRQDALARFATEYVEAALEAQGRKLVVMDPTELDDDLVLDMGEILTSFCARLYGNSTAENRARAALSAATSPGMDDE